jgi:hypothetical protein
MLILNHVYKKNPHDGQCGFGVIDRDGFAISELLGRRQ